MQELPAFSGGCQCGAVRYEVSPGPGTANVCFCEGCRRATGAAVTSFINVCQDRVIWFGKPALYHASDVTTRGFCATCGTPLFYAGKGSTSFAIAAGTSDTRIFPDMVLCHDQRPAWLSTIDALPRPDESPFLDHEDRQDVPNPGVLRTASEDG